MHGKLSTQGMSWLATAAKMTTSWVLNQHLPFPLVIHTRLLDLIHAHDFVQLLFANLASRGYAIPSTLTP